VRLVLAKKDIPADSKVNQKITLQKILVAVYGAEPSMDAADYTISISKNIMHNFMLCMLYELMWIYLMYTRIQYMSQQ
jgi:hypothetical protein